MIRILSIALLLTACSPDEGISNFIDKDTEFRLVELDNTPFVARATIQFPDAGEVVGQAPCNRYFATQSVPYPWISIDSIGATRMACPDMAAEAAFFAALTDMTLVAVQGRTLILSNSSGRRMVFQAP
jgi:heat shock protein HslJ